MMLVIYSLKKVSLGREIKLREFNFKVLHGILPCNKNLKQWKVKISDNCDVCGQIQTIEHLLWSCRYVQITLENSGRCTGGKSRF